MKKIISLILTFLMLSSINITAFSAENRDTIELITFTITDENGKAISCVNNIEGKINVETIVVNRVVENAGITLIAGIYDAENNRMKAFFTSEEYSLPKYEKKKLSLSASLKGLDDIEEGDIIRVFFWDKISMMTQHRDNINAKDASVFANIYVTDNITEFNNEKNVISGDRWSYVGHDIVNMEETFSAKKLISFEGKWWLDPNKYHDGANWFIEENGRAMSEKGKGVGWNYTIGEHSENCNLVIEGLFEGDSTTELYVFMSDYKSAEKVEIASPQKELLLRSGANNSFKIEIPAKEAIFGRNISFLPDWQQGGYIGNNLSVKITATPSKSVSTNSIKNYEDENVVGEGRWSYINAPAFSIASGVFTYDGLLCKGDGVIYSEDEYASDITDEDHTYYVNSKGDVYTDKNKMLGFVYTVGNKFNGASAIIVKGEAKCENSAFRIMIAKTSDEEVEVIGESATLLYNNSLSEHKIAIELNPEDVKPGDDIIFIIRTTSTTDWIPIKTDFTISGLFEE